MEEALERWLKRCTHLDSTVADPDEQLGYVAREAFKAGWAYANEERKGERHDEPRK